MRQKRSLAWMPKADVSREYVPNRHAVLPSLESYASRRSSFNAIDMADCMIQVCHRARLKPRDRF